MDVIQSETIITRAYSRG